MSFDRSTCKDLRAKLEAALKSVEAEMGIQFNIGNMRYDSHSINVSLRAVDVESTGGKSEGEALLEEMYPELVGKKCRLNGELFDIVEVLLDSRGNIRKTRSEVAIGIKKVVGGGSYKATVTSVRAHVVQDNGMPVPKAPANKPAPKQPHVPADGKPASKKDIAMQLIQSGKSRSDVIEILMTMYQSSKASASTTYQNAKKELGA